MHSYEEQWLAGMDGLPALPRLLFRLHNFYDVEPAAMAQSLATDRTSIALCLAEARTMIHARCAFDVPVRMPADAGGLAIAALERQLRRQHRDWAEQTLAESGYSGAILWPEPSEPIEADHEAVATLIVATLAPALRRAFKRSRRRGTATANLWRYIPLWRSIVRRRLDRVRRQISYSGWRRFDEWLADRIAPDRHYPDGYATPRVRRRPLPDEEGYEPASDLDAAPLSEKQRLMQARLASLPPLTHDAWPLFIRHGRTDEEIAERLGISARAARQRIDRAMRIVCGWRTSSLAFRLRFNIQRRWVWRRRQLSKILGALRD